MTLNTTLSISHSSRPRTAGPIRYAENRFAEQDPLKVT